MKTIDLRSDTVTRPSAEMRRAMFEAEVGDDVLGDDPTVIRLQEYAAGLLGKEAGLYFPSGTMCNQAAVRALTQRGDEVFLHAQAHIIFYEQGGASALSNVQLRCFDSPDGTLDLEKMEEYVHTDADVHWAPTRAGVPREHAQPLRRRRAAPRARARRARALRPARPQAAPRRRPAVQRRGGLRHPRSPSTPRPSTRSASACPRASGAPVGSVLVGDAATIALARRARKLYGGGMRQAGIIAAAGLYALQHNVARLADDHRRARALAERLAALPGLEVDLATVQTNMIFAGTRGTGLPAADLVARLRRGRRAVPRRRPVVRALRHAPRCGRRRHRADGRRRRARAGREGLTAARPAAGARGPLSYSPPGRVIMCANA